MTPFQSAAVAQAFEAFPPAARRKLMALRELIFKTAAATPGVGEIEEALKWGEPAYLTRETRAGSTVRIAWKKASPEHCAMYFNCQTDLVDTFRTLFPNDFEFEGRRAIVFGTSTPLPTDAVAFCIAAALTYHRRRRATGPR